jgi:stage II sporulation protein D
MAKGDKILVVNNIGLDEYLYGVLYHEVSHRWPTECLKAQAIVARTFALEQMRQNKTEPYDLRCDIYSQVYGGRSGEKWSTSHAVDATRGKVLTFNGDIFPTYYHATCSGYTEDASNLWKVDLLPLKGVPCNFCGRSKHYRWRKEFPLQQVREKLNGGGYAIGPISTVEILTRNRSGRNDRIKISDTAGGSVVITGKDFRQLFGPNEVRSTKFDAEIKRGFLVLNGMGWGHGVGMCQWGAFGMSERGKKCDEILKYYYPGTEIMTIDKLPVKQW